MLEEEEVGGSLVPKVVGPRVSQFGSKTGKQAEAGLIVVGRGVAPLRISLRLVLLLLAVLGRCCWVPPVMVVVITLLVLGLERKFTALLVAGRGIAASILFAVDKFVVAVDGRWTLS